VTVDIEDQAFDREIEVGTDTACVLVYHPGQLAHRECSPHAWHFHPLALQAELRAGRLISVSTCGDGAFRCRVTRGELTEREEKHRHASAVFRLDVRLGAVIFEGGYGLPSGAPEPEKEWSTPTAKQWLSLPNGHYRVVVSVIHWVAEEGAWLDQDRRQRNPNSLPDYVFQFQAVDDIETVPPLIDSPALDPFDVNPETFDIPLPSDSELRQRCQGQWPVVICDHQPLLPAHYVETVARREKLSHDYEEPDFSMFHSFMSLVAGDQAPSQESLMQNLNPGKHLTVRDHNQKFIVASQPTTPCLGAFVRPGPAVPLDDDTYRVFYSIEFLGRVLEIVPAEPWPLARIEPLTPSPAISESDLRRLTNAFTRFVHSNQQYRNQVAYPDLNAEEFAGLRPDQPVADILIHHLPLSAEARSDLLSRTRAEQIESLIAIMQSAG
jgi:hypothetical protein